MKTHKWMRPIIAIMVVTLSLLTHHDAEADDALIQRQTSVTERYQKLEELLLRLADVEAAENPERSALLRRAVRQSRDKFVLDKLRGASSSLRDQKFQAAVDNQGAAAEELQLILKLLTSEDRSKRIRDERERVAKMIKDLKRIERAQRSTRARTENGAELDELESEQKSIGDRSDKLNDQLTEDSEPPIDGSESEPKDGEPKDGEPKDGEPKDGEPKDGEPKDGEPKDGEPKDGEPKDGEPKDGEPKDGEPKDGEPKDGEPKDGEPKDGEPKDGEPKDGEPKDGEPKDGEPKDGEPKDGEPKDGEPKDGEPKDGEPKDGEPKDGEPKDGEPKDGEPKDGEPKDGEPKDGQPKDGEPKDGQSKDGQSKDGQSQSQQDSDQQPKSAEQQAQDELQKAIKRMREAEEQLKQTQRQAATDKQREAEENLRKAIDRLEQILRQLREEEMQRELARLEARLKKMAAMQSKLLDDTVSLAATPKQQRNRQTDLKAGDLAFEEKKVTLEADRAMLLLREEGSSIAFPEVIDQIRKDTVSVSELLGETKIDIICQGIQQDILAALDEMITALQKAQRELEQRQQQQQQQQQQQKPGEEPLVQLIAELKLIRTMETRVKKTTGRYAGLLESGDATADDILPLLQDLSERQNRLYQITRDLLLKRNQ